MLTVHQLVHENGIEYLDLRIYEKLDRNEDTLFLHTQTSRDSSGKLVERVLFRKQPHAGSGTAKMPV